MPPSERPARMSQTRREHLNLSMAALLAGLAPGAAQAAPTAAGARDFDFFFGRWQVKHLFARR